jgi:hypothetical protein
MGGYRCYAAGHKTGALTLAQDGRATAGGTPARRPRCRRGTAARPRNSYTASIFFPFLASSRADQVLQTERLTLRRFGMKTALMPGSGAQERSFMRESKPPRIPVRAVQG